MAKTGGTFEHTADVGIRAEADSLGELFEAMAEALAEFITPRVSVTPQEHRVVKAAAEDVEALAVDLLSAVLNVIQSDRFAVSSVAAVAADEHAAELRLAGELYDSTRHEIHTEVKAVTYHLLEVKNVEGKWRGRVIVDL